MYGIIENRRNISQLKISLLRDSTPFREYGPASGTVYYSYRSRSGSNATIGVKSADTLIKGYKWKRVVYRDRSAGKIAIRKFNKRTGYYFKREYPLVTKLIKVIIRKKRRKGMDLPPNPLEYHEVKFSKKPDSGTVTTDTGKWKYEGEVGYQHPALSTSALIGQNVLAHASPGITPVSQNYVTELDSVAYQRLLERTKDQRVNLAQAFAERAQTVRLLADSAVRLAEFIASVKRGNVNGALKKLLPQDARGVSSDWLAYQYGVRPLISDIQGLVDELGKGNPAMLDIIGSARKTPTSNGCGYANDNGSYIYGPNCSWSTKLDADVGVKYKLRARVTHGGLKLINSIGLSNPATIAWELTPWSFVIDWFIPIGDYLNMVDALVGVDPLYAHRTVFVKETITGTKTYGGYDPNFRVVWSEFESQYRVERVYCKRSVLPSFPTLAFPKLRSPLSTTHLANAIALLLVNFKR